MFHTACTSNCPTGALLIMGDVLADCSNGALGRSFLWKALPEWTHCPYLASCYITVVWQMPCLCSGLSCSKGIQGLRIVAGCCEWQLPAGLALSWASCIEAENGDDHLTIWTIVQLRPFKACQTMTCYACQWAWLAIAHGNALACASVPYALQVLR